MRLWRPKAVLQATDTLLGPGKVDANDVGSLFRADIKRLTKSFQFLDVLCCWRGFNKAVVALANKNARIGWLIVARDATYDSSKAFAPA